MLPVKTNTDLVLNMRITALKSEIVVNNLTDIEIILTEAGTKKRISNIEQSELVNKVGVLAKFIARDAGIKTWKDSEMMKYDSMRFYDILRKYYRNLTIDEVKLAFELSVVGGLDEFLPKDRNGTPDKNHYQVFSIEYITKILNAYRRKKGATWTKVYKLLPIPKKVVTAKEKEEIRLKFVNSIYSQFYNYRDNMKRPVFYISFLVIEEFIKQGIITESPKYTKDTINNLLKLLASDNISGISKANRNIILNEKEKGLNSSLLEKMASNTENMKVIMSVFNNWIKEKIDIKDILK